MIRSFTRPRLPLLCLAWLACPAGAAWSAELCPNLNVTVSGTDNTITGCVLNPTETLLMPAGTGVTNTFMFVYGTVANAGSFLVPGVVNGIASGIEVVVEPEVIVGSPNKTHHVFRNLAGGVFDNGGYIRLQSTNFSATFGGATFDNAGTLNNHYRVEVGNGNPYSNFSLFNNTGTVHSDGLFTIYGTLANHPGGGGFFNDANGVISNTANGIIANDGPFTNAAGATITNAGTFDNNAGGVLSNAGTVQSTGRFANNAGATLNNTGSFAASDLLDDGDLVNDGTLRITDGTSGPQTSTLVVNGRLLNHSSGQVFSLGTLSVGASGVVENGGSLLIDNTNATLNNDGTITNLSGGTLGLASTTQLNNRAGARLVSQGTINNGFLLNNAGTLDLQDGSLLNNNTLRNLPGGLLTIDGIVVNHTIQNSGSVAIGKFGLVQGDGRANERYQQTAGTTRVDGVLASALVDVQGGTITGTGTIGRPGSTINIAAPAIVDPGSSNQTGTLSFQGNTRLAGRLEIDLASDSAFDILQNIGALDFVSGSQIELRFGNGFHAALGSHLTIIDASSVTGLLTMTGLGLPTGYAWDLAVDAVNGDIGIDFTAVPLATPLPGSLSMLASALFGGLLLRKPRRRG